MEVWAENEILYDGKVVRLRVGEVILDDGRRALREVVEHPGGVCVIPFTGDSVIFVKQFRIALGKELLEAPAGKIEVGEAPAYRAACELEEETGYRAGALLPVGFVYASVGFCSEKIHLFLGLELVKTQQRLDDDERIELVTMPLDDVRRMLRENDFEDAKTVVGLHALLAHLDNA